MMEYNGGLLSFEKRNIFEVIFLKIGKVCISIDNNHHIEKTINSKRKGVKSRVKLF